MIWLIRTLLFVVLTASPGMATDRRDGARQLPIDLRGSLQNPVFSPSGEWLLFTRFRKGYNRGASDLYLYHFASGTLKPLVSDGSSNVNLPGSSWNRNGVITFSSDRGQHDEIFVITASGVPGDEQQVTNRADLQAYEPSFSPDGKWLVFESHLVDDDAGKITKYNLLSGAYLDLTVRSEVIKQPNWSPRGSQILYQTLIGGEWVILTMKANGQAPRRVTPTGISATDAVFSPNARRIFFSGERSDIRRANIFSIRINGTDLRQITHWGGYDGAVSVSPNGRRIAFEGIDNDPDRSPGTVLWLLDL